MLSQSFETDTIKPQGVRGCCIDKDEEFCNSTADDVYYI